MSTEQPLVSCTTYSTSPQRPRSRLTPLSSRASPSFLCARRILRCGNGIADRLADYLKVTGLDRPGPCTATHYDANLLIDLVSFTPLRFARPLRRIAAASAFGCVGCTVGAITSAINGGSAC